jgi:hypothetical protein
MHSSDHQHAPIASEDEPGFDPLAENAAVKAGPRERAASLHRMVLEQEAARLRLIRQPGWDRARREGNERRLAAAQAAGAHSTIGPTDLPLPAASTAPRARERRDSTSRPARRGGDSGDADPGLADEPPDEPATARASRAARARAPPARSARAPRVRRRP